jgi:hypothetical protein
MPSRIAFSLLGMEAAVGVEVPGSTSQVAVGVGVNVELGTWNVAGGGLVGVASGMTLGNTEQLRSRARANRQARPKSTSRVARL